MDVTQPNWIIPTQLLVLWLALLEVYFLGLSLQLSSSENQTFSFMPGDREDEEGKIWKSVEMSERVSPMMESADCI